MRLNYQWANPNFEVYILCEYLFELVSSHYFLQFYMQLFFCYKQLCQERTNEHLKVSIFYLASHYLRDLRRLARKWFATSRGMGSKWSFWPEWFLVLFHWKPFSACYFNKLFFIKFAKSVKHKTLWNHEKTWINHMLLQLSTRSL